MIRTLLACSAIAFAFTAHADVTIKTTSTGKGFGISGSTTSTTYIKGLKMRADSSMGGSPTSTIIDLEAQKFISLNHKKKEAQVLDMAKLRQDMDKMVKGAEAASSLKPTGEKKEFAGKSCTGYEMTASMPMAMGEGMEMTMVMTGPVFIARGAPGSADYAKFYLAAAEKGFIANDPRAAKGAAQQTKGMTALYKAIAETGGIPYYMETSVKIEGGGPMASMMSKMMGGAAFSTTVTAVSTEAIPDDKFAIPADYKVKESR